MLSVLEKVTEALEKVEHQPANAEKYGALESGPATYGVVKKLRDNDMDLHTDKQVYLHFTKTTIRLLEMGLRFHNIFFFSNLNF